jgi:hypothetical protein
MRTRTIIFLSVGVLIALILFVSLAFAINAADFERPKTKYVCTSSATYTPDTGEQQTEIVCVEQ